MAINAHTAIDEGASVANRTSRAQGFDSASRRIEMPTRGRGCGAEAAHRSAFVTLL